jgi:hypothetical protein
VDPRFIAAQAAATGDLYLPMVAVLVWLLFFLTAVWVWFSFAWRTAQFFVRPLLLCLGLAGIAFPLIANASPTTMFVILLITLAWPSWFLGFYRQGRFGSTTVHMLAALTLPISSVGILLLAARGLELMFH